MQKKIALNILLSDIQTLEGRHSGKYISNVMCDTHHVQRNLISTGVLEFNERHFFCDCSCIFRVLSKLEASFYLRF